MATGSTTYWDNTSSTIYVKDLGFVKPQKIKPVHDPLRPPVYFDQAVVGIGGVYHAWPDEIITSSMNSLGHYLLGAQYKCNKELTLKNTPNYFDQYDLDDFIKDNPWVDFFCKNYSNYILGVTKFDALYNIYRGTFKKTPGILLYSSSIKYNYSTVIPNPPKSSVTEFPSVPVEFRKNTIVSSYRNLMRNFPFTKNPTWYHKEHNGPWWWLYDDLDEAYNQSDKQLYKVYSGRAQ